MVTNQKLNGYPEFCVNYKGKIRLGKEQAMHIAFTPDSYFYYVKLLFSARPWFLQYYYMTCAIPNMIWNRWQNHILMESVDLIGIGWMFRSKNVKFTLSAEHDTLCKVTRMF